MSDAFVSYSRRNQAFVKRLEVALHGAGLDVWVDYHDIPPSFDWLENIKDGVDGASAVLCVVTADYLESEMCSLELRLSEEAGKRLVPLIVDATPADAVPSPLRPYNWLFADSAGQLDDTAELVAAAVHADPEWTTTHTRLLLRAREWEQSGRGRRGLLRGAQLRDTVTAVAVERPADQPQPTSLQREYVTASQRAAARRRVTGGIAAAVIAATITAAAVLLLSTRQRAERGEATAQSRELAALALDLLEDDHDLALLLAVESARIADTRESYGALLRTALHAPEVERHLHWFDGQLRGAAFVADGRRLVAGGEGGGLAMWSVDDGELVATVPPIDVSIMDVAATPDGSMLATAHDDGTVRLWDVDELDATLVEQVHGRIGTRSLAFSPDGGLLASGSGSGRVVISDTSPDLRPRATVLERPGAIAQLRWSGDGGHLAAVHGDGVDVLDGAGDHELLTSIDLSDATTAAWGPDGSTIAIGRDDGTIRLFQLEDNGGPDARPIWRSRTPHDGAVTALRYATDGTLRSADSRGTIRAWDPDQSAVSDAGRTVHSTRVRALVSDGAQRLASVGSDGSAILWNDERAPRIAQPVAAYAGASSLSGEPWGTTTAAGLNDGGIIVSDHAAAQPPVGLPGDGEPITDVALAQQGSVVIAGNGSGTVTRLSVSAPSGDPLVVRREPERITAVTAGADGQLVAWGTDGGMVGLYDAAADATLVEGLQVFPLGVFDIAFRPFHDEVAVVGASSSVERLATDQLAPIAALSGAHTDWLDAVAYTPDGDSLVTVGAEELVVWDLEQGSHTMLPNLHGARITAVAFNTHGTLMATGDASGTIVLWDPMEDWQPFGTALDTPFTAGVGEITFLPSQTLVVAGAGENPVSYDLDPSSLQQVLCEVANRRLSEQERVRSAIDGRDGCDTRRPLANPLTGHTTAVRMGP